MLYTVEEYIDIAEIDIDIAEDKDFISDYIKSNNIKLVYSGASNHFNKSIMEEDSQKVEAFLAPLRSAVSGLYVAGNVAGAVRYTNGNYAA